MENRIKEIRKIKNLTQGTFAEKLNVAPNYVYLIETGKKIPSEKLIKQICDVFRVNETWLRTGEGEMLSPKTREQEIAEITASIIKENNPIRIELDKIVHKLTDEQLENVYKMAKQLVEAAEKEKDNPQ